MTAMDCVKAIDEGFNATRPKDTNEDRIFRNMVYNMQCNGRLIVNVGDGNGYFEADMNNPEEAAAVRKYIRSKKRRISREAASIKAMEQTIANINQLDFFDDLEGIC